MRFTDFKQKDLIGKLVIWTTSNVVTNENTKIILTIENVSRFGFQIKDNPDKWFSYGNGHEKMVNGILKTNSVSYCELTTEEEADALRDRWRIVKEKMEYIKVIIENKKKLLLLDTDQLKKISEVVSGTSVNVDLGNFEIKNTVPVNYNHDDSVNDAVESISSLINDMQDSAINLLKQHRDQLTLIGTKIKSLK